MYAGRKDAGRTHANKFQNAPSGAFFFAYAPSGAFFAYAPSGAFFSYAPAGAFFSSFFSSPPPPQNLLAQSARKAHTPYSF